MSDSNVLVVFYSRGGLTERLAVLLAEGALQGGAKIRLRRSRDVMAEALIAEDGAWKANRDRMHEEFAAPRIADVEWADVVAFGTPAGPGTVGLELGATLAEIGLKLPRRVLAGKAATPFTSSYAPVQGAELAAANLASGLARLGFVTLPRPLAETGDYETARVHGRQAAALGRVLRGWQDR
jgi:NAD(P)H dehydrogenase (quinone)